MAPGESRLVFVPEPLDVRCLSEGEKSIAIHHWMTKMPIEIKYVDDGFGVEFIGSGVVDAAEVIEARKQTYRHKNFLKQKYQIVDRTHVTEFRLNYDDIKKIAELDKVASVINPNVIVALVSPTDLQYGLSRVYEAYVKESGFLTGVFRDRRSAEAWIRRKLLTM